MDRVVKSGSNRVAYVSLVNGKKGKGSLAVALLALGLGIVTVWTAKLGYGNGDIVFGGQARAVGILWILLALTIFYSYFRR
jgi:hypothetical protein